MMINKTSKFCGRDLVAQFTNRGHHLLRVDLVPQHIVPSVTAHGGWRGLTGKQPRALIIFFSNPYLKLLSDMIFKDQQGHSKQGFKVVSKMRGPNLSRSQRECCPSKNNMIHYQWSYLTHPWI